MPNNDGTGPRKGSRGLRDGKGVKRRLLSNTGVGKKKGGKKGNC